VKAGNARFVSKWGDGCRDITVSLGRCSSRQNHRDDRQLKQNSNKFAVKHLRFSLSIAPEGSPSRHKSRAKGEQKSGLSSRFKRWGGRRRSP
jgi:hypothetical protein